MNQPTEWNSIWVEGPYARRHLQFGWWALLAFLSLGIGLELLHALKLGWYLDVENETRRMQLTLGHAHGTFIAIANIVFGFSLRMRPTEAWQRYASLALISSAILVPVGFILGGLSSRAGDPGIGIVLTPVGAILLLVGVLLTALGMAPPESRPHWLRRWLAGDAEAGK